ncbi:hypothetical protein C0992_010040 [Termitomyces sp. T32_za158]|nr:hypothetical protein C0992_010040 [Termitomyces sp. T32_za158]
MSRFTLDSAAEFLFGYNVHSLTAGIPYPHNAAHVPPNSVSPQAQNASEFAVAFLQVQEIIARRNLYGWMWPLTEIIEDKTKKPMEIVRAFLDPIIKEALVKNANVPQDASKEEETESHVEEGETLIDHLVRLSSAGRDTTASTLTFVIYCLAMYPAIHVRLREEVLARVGPTRRPDYDDIRDMKYLRAVINGTPGDFLRTFRQQQFTSVSLDVAASPPQAKPPAHWAKGVGRKAIEKVYPKSHLTMYTRVSNPPWIQ